MCGTGRTPPPSSLSEERDRRSKSPENTHLAGQGLEPQTARNPMNAAVRDVEYARIPAHRTPSAANAGQAGTAYYLAGHIFACATPHGAVLLDLRRNKYYGLDLTDVVSLADIVLNWPAKRSSAQNVSTAALDRPRRDTLVRSLLEANILQQSPPTDRDIGRSMFSLDGELVSVGDEIIAKAPVRPAHVAAFLFSLLSAFVSLRFLRLNFTVRVVHERKARALAKGYWFDPDRAAQLTFVFRRLRPYLFSANGNCMMHALALVNFMAIYGEFPCWVLGVKTQPWGAHSWVQHEKLLLDTNPAKVCPYNPLLCV